MSLASHFPRCPDCGRQTRVWRDIEESNRGQPNTWWCADCTTVLRARHAEGAWDVYDLGPGGELLRRPAKERGEAFVQRALAAMEDVPGLPVMARYLYLQLILRADATGAVQAGAATISAWTHCHRATVFVARGHLREFGMLTWEARGADMAATRYQIEPPEGWNRATRPSRNSRLVANFGE